VLGDPGAGGATLSGERSAVVRPSLAESPGDRSFGTRLEVEWSPDAENVVFDWAGPYRAWWWDTDEERAKSCEEVLRGIECQAGQPRRQHCRRGHRRRRRRRPAHHRDRLAGNRGSKPAVSLGGRHLRRRTLDCLRSLRLRAEAIGPPSPGGAWTAGGQLARRSPAGTACGHERSRVSRFPRLAKPRRQGTDGRSPYTKEPRGRMAPGFPFDFRSDGFQETQIPTPPRTSGSSTGWWPQRSPAGARRPVRS